VRQGKGKFLELEVERLVFDSVPKSLKAAISSEFVA
jgi:hypothetical protein